MAESRSPKHPGPGGQPFTIKECIDQALEYSFDVHIPLKIYMRSFRMIFKEANIYWGEGDLTQAYILMYRASDLILKNVRSHPEYKSSEGRKMLKEITSQAHQVIRDLEILKPLVEAQHDEWERTIGARKRIWNGNYEESPPSKKQFSPKVLDARDQQNQSLNQVLKNVNRRSATIRRPARSYTIDYDEKRRGNVYDKWDPPVLRSISPEVEMDEDETRRQMEAARRTLDFTDPKRFLHDTEGMDSSYATCAPSYPTLRPSLPIEVTADSIPHVSSPPLSPLTEPHPSRPRDDQEESPIISPQQSPRFKPPPPVPQKSQLRDRGPPPRPEKILIERRAQVSEEPPPQAHSELESNEMSGKAPAPPPKVGGPEDASPKSEKNDVVFQTADYLESGEPLRSLFIAKDLRAKFLRIAEPNTAKGLELCGLLCGQLYKNALFATRLLIPEQVCTENTCDTVNEERIWEFCDEHDVLVMGWIHTHPTQTCFLSSRDLHTHAVYQVQLPESVAIVCAPKFNEYGIFRCTDPPGRKAILKCDRPGVFHPHDPYRDDELYKSCGANEHAMETSQLQTTVTDLRAKAQIRGGFKTFQNRF